MYGQPWFNWVWCWNKGSSAHFAGVSTFTCCTHMFGQCGTQCAACWDVWCSVGRLLSTCFLTPAESNCKHSAAVSTEQTGNQMELKPVATLKRKSSDSTIKICSHWEMCDKTVPISAEVCFFVHLCALYVFLQIPFISSLHPGVTTSVRPEHTGSSSAAVSSSSSPRRCAPACFWSLSRLTKAETKARTSWCFTMACQLSLTLPSLPVEKYWSEWGLRWPRCR